MTGGAEIVTEDLESYFEDIIDHTNLPVDNWILTTPSPVDNDTVVVRGAYLMQEMARKPAYTRP